MDTTYDFNTRITSSVPISPAVSGWRMYLTDKGRSIHTVKAFTADVQMLASYFAPDKSIGSISTHDLATFIEWLQQGRGVPCSPKSLSRRITSIKAFFSWLHKSGVLEINPAEKLLQHTVISPLPEILTHEELQKLITTAESYRQKNHPDSRPYLLFKLLIESGIKKGEALTLNVNHLDATDPLHPSLYVRYSNPNNRMKERKILLSAEWLRAYQEYTKQYAVNERLLPWSPRRLEYILEDLGKDAGVEKHVSFDMCRWTCAHLDWKNGNTAEAIRQKLGISKIQWREVGMKLKELAVQNP